MTASTMARPTTASEAAFLRKDAFKRAERQARIDALKEADQQLRA